MKKIWFVAFLGVLSLTACNSPNSTNTTEKAPTEVTSSELAVDRAEVQPYIEGYAGLVYETYKDSRTDAEAMKSAIASFLAEPNESNLSAAKDAWIKARQSYLQTEAFRFYDGPIDFVNKETGEEGPEGRINAWPMNEAFIDYVKDKPDSGFINNPDLVVSIKTIIENDQVSDEADVTTGWHAIEFLLWGQDFNADSPGKRPASDFVPSKDNNDRRRDYLELVTNQLVDDLTALEAEWQPDQDNYRASFIKADPQTNLSKIFTSLATLSAFEMGAERIATALDSGDQEDEHSCFSDTTHQDFVFNAKGIANVYMGNYKNYNAPGFDELIAKLNPEVNTEVVAAIEQTQTAIGKIQAPFDQVLASPAESPQRQTTEEAVEALENQAEQFRKIAPVLGIEVDILAE
jgi:putative iron-regulated protein